MQSTIVPVNGENKPSGAFPVFPIPIGLIVARGFMLFLSVVILGLAGYLMHGYVMDANAFAFVCGLFTIIIAIYAIVTEKVASCHPAYNYWAILALDLLMIIFWLSSMAANAALRAAFVVSVDVSCYNDGSTLNSNHCIYTKRSEEGSVLEKRAAVTNQVGRDMISAIAGLSAIQMLLSIATFAYLAHTVRIYRQNRPQKNVVAGGEVLYDMKAQNIQPAVYGVQQPQQQQPQQYQQVPLQPQQQPQQQQHQQYQQQPQQFPQQFQQQPQQPQQQPLQPQQTPQQQYAYPQASTGGTTSPAPPNYQGQPGEMAATSYN